MSNPGSIRPVREAGLFGERKQRRTKSVGTISVHERVKGCARDTAENFRVLVASVIDYAIFMLDPEGRVVSWNAGAQRLKGYREDEIIGQHFSRFYPLEDVERGRPELGLRLALAEGRFEDEGWRVRKSGSTFWANVIITPLQGKSGELLGFAKITRDLTERKRATEKIKATEARLRAFMNHSSSLMFIKDLDGRYVHVNDAFTRAFGLGRKDILFRSDSDIFPAEVAAQFRANDAKALTTRGGVEVEEVAPYRDGVLHTSIVHKFPLFDAKGQITALGGVVTDITERKTLEEALKQRNDQLKAAMETEFALREQKQRLEHVAMRDALTGVPNRALLYQRAEHAILVSRRSSRLLAFLFIDLDRFKHINDTFGHSAGDQVLREVAARLSGCLREVDTIARHGGDEFVVLLEDIESPEEIEQVVARMQEVLAQPLAVNGEKVAVTSSIGVALYPRDAQAVATLIDRADVAMYRAKELGRNRVQFYLPELASKKTHPVMSDL